MQDQQNFPDFKLSEADLSLLGKHANQHKYSHGHAIVMSGPSGQGGAARLAARAALRVGAGVVSVMCDRAAVTEHAARLDAIMVKPCDEAQALAEQILALRPSAICIGPNLGLGPCSVAKLKDVVTLDVPLCLDADALSLIAQDPSLLPSRPKRERVMTPHEDELRRLIPEAFEQTHDRQSLARIAAQKMGFIVLFKGHDTVVARPDGGGVVVRSAEFPHAPWLATAGSGDVLSGIITGLLARGAPAFVAASLGAYLHLRCAQAFGPGLIAEDIAEELPGVLSRLLRTD